MKPLTLKKLGRPANPDHCARRREEIAKRIQQERSEYDRLMSSVEQLYAQGALATESTSHSVYVEGASNLVLTEQDKERLRQLLATLEEKQRVVDLLSAYLDTDASALEGFEFLTMAVAGEDGQ
jgi:transcriptional regulator of heat shock response